MSAEQKRIAQPSLSTFHAQDSDPGTDHKQTQFQKTYRELLQARTLLEELGRKVKPKFVLSPKDSNKATKVANPRKTATIIHHIHTPQGQTLAATTDISIQFERYYSDLYNLSPVSHTSDNMRPYSTVIQDFLNLHCPRPISHFADRKRDGMLTYEEFKLAIK